MATTNLKQPIVAIVREQTPQESVLKGLERIGGIQNHIDKGDNVFIKVTLDLPKSYPTTVNLDALKELIDACRNAGANKINVGSFPYEGTSIKDISETLGLEGLFKEIGVELAYLDNSNRLSDTDDKKKFLKSQTSEKIFANNRLFYIPKTVLESNKLISFNQVKVHPLFHHTSSILNSYSLISPEDQEVKCNKACDTEYLATDQYKKEMVAKIVDVYSIKIPTLIINDLFYILEGAGPFVFKDSNMVKTGTIVVGNDAFSVDLITSNLLNVAPENDEILNEAHQRGLGSFDLSKIQLDGTLKDYGVIVEPCQKILSDIHINEINVLQGQMCSGCHVQAYYLLNFLKTILLKDLKYMSETSFLLGDKPPIPVSQSNNIIVFGDCAIKSTKDSDFRVDKITKKKKQKLKPNKNVLEIKGCPPTALNALPQFLEHFRENNMPVLTLLNSLCSQKLKKNKGETN
ncbi:MAG: DUF362 domain-containing protein [Candidatus Lokiarchaeota archaeon]|nr:DUF362 domain-containing protein [Candidatus Lokiarchaeota archaeon]